MKDGFLRVAAHSPALRVGDCAYNADQIAAIILADDTCALHVFPELCLTGATCGDLFLQPTLLRGAEVALISLLQATEKTDAVFVVGLPVRYGNAVYNCAAVCHGGELLGLVPKTRVTAEERRWFADGKDAADTPPYRMFPFVGREHVLFKSVGVFRCVSVSEFCLGVEFGDDLFADTQPSTELIRGGATVIACLSAMPSLVGRVERVAETVKVQSARLRCAYVFANAGLGESTADAVYTGGGVIAACGKVLADTTAVGDTTEATATEIDVQNVLFDRCAGGTDNKDDVAVRCFAKNVQATPLSQQPNPHPFEPADAAARAVRCEQVLSLQAAALARRLSHTNSQAVVGLSGGLDSTLALLVIVRAYRLLGRDMQGAVAVTMPCFGTTNRTYTNACEMAKACGVTLREVNIAAAVTQHFSDIGHGGNLDVTYENAQARERTQVLMDIANQTGALVVGTGDLSELVLGWATYNGDHMSMYGVNGSVPKTLVRALVSHEAARVESDSLRAVLRDILDTPVSPELLPPENGTISQKTEQIVGNYELHDFFLYHILRHGCAPAKVYRLACTAFDGQFAPAEIKTWLCVFLRRFFSQQFKRNCLPDGAAVGSIGVSPRGGWVMPSDAVAALWLCEAETL